MISAARPDLIILDLHLAETATSWSLIGALREHVLTSRTPIIALMSKMPDREADQLQLSIWSVQIVFGSDDVMAAVQKTLAWTFQAQQI
jgi:CheY-like chemotaxis protein